jgi:L-iditol 2-dehydrogenase
MQCSQRIAAARGAESLKLARYVGSGRIEICDEPEPALPPGGLLVRTEASGLCSGELMGWYMERKVPHVLGHEVAGRVIASEDERYPVGSRVAPHHHAACGKCEHCLSGRHVHCRQWKRSKLNPGGMAELFAVAAENLDDTHLADELRPEDAALVEPLACVVKSVRHLAGAKSIAIIGLGAMGLMHLALLRDREAVGIEKSAKRLDWARSLGLGIVSSEAEAKFDAVVACPGSQEALDLALQLAGPGSKVVLFAPMPPGKPVEADWDRLYFQEISLIPSYSCGPSEMAEAMAILRKSQVKAEQVVSHFIGIDELPEAYEAMKKGEILKPMVMFD